MDKNELHRTLQLASDDTQLGAICRSIQSALFRREHDSSRNQIGLGHNPAYSQSLNLLIQIGRID